MKAVAIRHVLFEDLGLIAPSLVANGYEIEYLDAGIDALDRRLVEADLLVVLGGPIGVGDVTRYPFLADEIASIGARLKAERPTLGVCLGAQLMAAALGAEVKPGGKAEIGFGELALTRAGEASVLAPLREVPVFHWHGDEFMIPDGAERLAATEGFPNQAFSRGSSTLGLQFHIEADLRFLERWLIGHAGELVAAGVDPQSIRDQSEIHGTSLATAARQVLEDWLGGI